MLNGQCSTKGKRAYGFLVAIDTFDGAQDFGETSTSSVESLSRAAPPFRVGKWFDMAHYPELVEGEAPLSVNPEQAPAFRPESRRVDFVPSSKCRSSAIGDF
jgi:hypothetical protein